VLPHLAIIQGSSTCGLHTRGQAPPACAPLPTQDQSEMLRATRTAILDEDELLELFESRARQAIASAGPDDPRGKEPNRRYMVGGRACVCMCMCERASGCVCMHVHVRLFGCVWNARTPVTWRSTGLPQLPVCLNTLLWPIAYFTHFS